MTWVAVAIGGAAVIGAGASYAGASKQAKASKQAGQLNMDMFNTINRQEQPFIQGGYGAMGKLNTLLGLNPRPQPSAPMMSTPMTAPGIDTSGMGPMEKMFAQMMAKRQAQGQASGNAYMPTPGGGVQPIMQAGGPGGDPYMNRNARLNQILQLRARNGDTQAADMMRAMAGLG